MERIDPDRLDLAAEFLRQPMGPYSPELLKMLKLLRWRPLLGRSIAIEPAKGQGWYLATLNVPKGTPLSVDSTRCFESVEDAHRAVFAERWEFATGAPLSLPSHSSAPEQNCAKSARGRVAGSLWGRRSDKLECS